MHESIISRRTITLIVLYTLLFLAVLFFVYFHDQRTLFVFCNVGPGDATYIRVHNKVDILIDAGPNTLINTCLGKHMPFYDRTIEYAFLTHVKKSQYEGYNGLIKRYNIEHFIPIADTSPAMSYQKLIKRLHFAGTKIYTPVDDEIIPIDTASLRVHISQKNTNANNDLLKTRAFTIEFQEDRSRVLLIGYPSLTDSIDSVEQGVYTSPIVRISEYGFDKDTFMNYFKLAERLDLLINTDKLKATELQTLNKSLQKSALNIMDSEDIVYKL